MIGRRSCQSPPAELRVLKTHLCAYPKAGGHVSTVVDVSKDGTQVFCLGGNQNGALNISACPLPEGPEKEQAANLFEVIAFHIQAAREKLPLQAPTPPPESGPASK
jgi:hypothetical protein